MSNSHMLAEMALMKRGASHAPLHANTPSEKFSDLFIDALKNTNAIQSQASDLTRRFVSGESGISAADVMRMNHKSEISMEATKQVRNKLLEQYKEILNTQL
ncbi:hypothetical protein EA58_14005 [Photobacterium galatheae]|uniref:Flagellar hook-basal body complex protein FliE n=1 Tax=Photobacterium galatheae TaxID=1654360 RepID=A0A066RK99_9GAMM|nr:hypothetical protein EA58_14005 [Photobacterium galatheae]